jgi:hypothetical protein
MNTFPAPSETTEVGYDSDASVAGPPSPENAACPLPAMVLIVPDGDTFRIAMLLASAMYRLPVASTVTPVGVSSDALVATPPSPEYPANPLPATVLMIPLGLTLRIR